MHFVIFGLSVSSSWGNGHATIWRSLLKAMSQRGHTASFYEKDVPYYATTRDGWPPPDGIRLRLYSSFAEVCAEAALELASANVAICTSYCPDGQTASQLILDSRTEIKAFYDLDTPVTLTALHSAVVVPYIPPDGLGAFDLVLSYTGGRSLGELQNHLGARRVAPLYGSVDPDTHCPAGPVPEFCADLSYLGTYAVDRQAALQELFLKPAAQMPYCRFAIAGAQYPENFPWKDNIFFVRHLAPSWHPVFFCSARATLNITRASMAEYGYCPSGRLFEAAACGATILSDWWEGLETFFKQESEILRVRSAEDVRRALSLTDREMRNIGRAARERALGQHTAIHRIIELESICEGVLNIQSAVTTT